MYTSDSTLIISFLPHMTNSTFPKYAVYQRSLKAAAVHKSNQHFYIFQQYFPFNKLNSSDSV